MKRIGEVRCQCEHGRDAHAPFLGVPCIAGVGEVAGVVPALTSRALLVTGVSGLGGCWVCGAVPGPC